MESALTKACTIKIQNFEGPFDLLFHLIEKNKMNIYDIPINNITDQYMDYLYAMQQLDLEIASEFLLMAATLLHIKSKMLLPEKKEQKEQEVDPREELILKLVEYKKYKEFSQVLKAREQQWEKVYYKLPEVIEYKREDEVMELCPEQLKKVYIAICDRNRRKMNNTAEKMTHIMQHEKVSLKSKMREIIRTLINKTVFKFAELFAPGKSSRLEIVTGFLAALELAKLNKVKLEQKRQFTDILVYRTNEDIKGFEHSIHVADGD